MTLWTMTNLTSILLCGGQSTRMGTDKGLVPFSDKIWAEIGLEKLKALNLPTAVSVNESQLLSYSARLSDTIIIADNPELDVQGPLLGLLSAHLKFPKEDILLLACDLIQMDTIVLKTLVDSFNRARPKAMAFKGDHVEPLCAIYSSGGLKEIHNHYENGQPQKFSMHTVLDRLNAAMLPIPEDWNDYFTNFNNEADLDRSGNPEFL